jgi:hypothetical protein
MTSTVSPVGSDPSSDPAPAEPASAHVRTGLVRRLAEEEHIVVVLLAVIGLMFLVIFPPALLVNDSWMNLTLGRELVENGLPSVDELTIYGMGQTWTDQQWGAQLFIYGVYSLGGFALLSIMACVFVVGAFSLAAAASRSLGAGPRAIWLLFLPVLVTAALGWSIRAQMLTLPLYAGLLWLLAAQARRPTNLVWISLPMLVVWGNLHGSAALGALLVVLLGAYELVRARGRSWLRCLGLVVLAPLAVLVTPYGPVATARYYHLLLVDPPFADQVTEWRWPAPAPSTYAFYVLLAIAVPLVIWGRRRLTVFDIAVLAVTLAGALTAIRGIPWFAFACMVFVPVAIGRSLESRRPSEPRRGLNVAICSVLVGANVLAAFALLFRSDAYFEDFWPNEPVDAIRAELRPDDRVFIPDRFSDWLLWKIPELRGRIAYDVRFEVYDKEFFNRLARYHSESGAEWKSFADGYRIVVVDETKRSHTADFLEEPGARAIYRGDEITVIARSEN